MTRDESLLQEILKHSCPERFTVSGEEGKKLDCFVVYCNWNDEESILKGHQNGFFQGLNVNSDTKKYDIPIEMSSSDIENSELTIQHYWHGNTISFDSLKDFRFHRLTKLVYLKLTILTIIHKITSFFYRRTKMVAPDRMALLQIILHLSLKKQMGRVPKTEIIATTLGKRWSSHPNGMEEFKKLRLIFDSLVVSNDITGGGDAYQPTGKALSTLQSYELEERRYNSQVRLQKWLVIATIVIAVSALKDLGLLDWLIDLIKRISA